MDDEVARYDAIVARIGDASDAALRTEVATAADDRGCVIERDLDQGLINKGVALGELDRPEEELAVYGDLVARFDDATEPILREAVTIARTALERSRSD